MKLNVYTSSFFNRMNFVGIYSSGFLRAVVIPLYSGDYSFRFFLIEGSLEVVFFGAVLTAIVDLRC